MADPQVIVCEQACTITVQHEFSIPLLELTPAQGSVIAGGVLAVWVVGWSIRQIILLLRNLGADHHQPE